jgi:hypothetical protein
MEMSDKSAPLVESIDVDIGSAHGLVCAYGALYVVVSGNAAQGPGFYRVCDTDGDDQYDDVELLKSFAMRQSKARFNSLTMRLQNMLIS